LIDYCSNTDYTGAVNKQKVAASPFPARICSADKRGGAVVLRSKVLNYSGNVCRLQLAVWKSCDKARGRALALVGVVFIQLGQIAIKKTRLIL
jgi:hypothetical protein